MKKPKITAFVLAAVLSSTPVLAAEVPKEAAPINATEESIIITENLISPILEEVKNGLGFGEAWGKASREIYSAVIAGNTNAYGYADLTAIARTRSCNIGICTCGRTTTHSRKPLLKNGLPT